MSTDTSTSLRLSRVINADRDAVWAAWTEEKQMRQWMAPEGVELPTLSADVAVGGKYHLGMRSPNGEHNARGTYTEVDRPNRLAYTWEWDEEEINCGETLVTVEFNEMGASTEVIITHDRFPAPEARDSHSEGWTSCLGRLEAMYA